MLRRVLLLGSFVLALSLGLSLTYAQTTPTTGASPTTGPAEPLVENPHYLAWAKFKPGTTVDLDMILHMAGQQMTTNVTMTLNEITPEKAVVASVAKMNVPGLPPQEQKQTHAFAAKVVQSEAEGAFMPPGAQGESKEAAAETVEAAGKKYDCKVREFTGKMQGQEAKGKMWRSETVPGGLVKMESSSAGTVSKVEMVLKKVTEK